MPAFPDLLRRLKQASALTDTTAGNNPKKNVVRGLIEGDFAVTEKILIAVAIISFLLLILNCGGKSRKSGGCDFGDFFDIFEGEGDGD